MSGSLLARLFVHSWFWVLTSKFYVLPALFLKGESHAEDAIQKTLSLWVPHWLMRQDGAAKDGQQSLALAQASLYKQQSLWPSMVLQAGKASCCLPVAVVVPAGSTVPVDKWKLLLSVAFPFQCFLMPKVAQTTDSQTVPLKLSAYFSWRSHDTEGENGETSF